MDRDRLDLALNQCEHTSSFRILISHNPLVKDQIHEDYQIRLILAGHTHGGQIRILGYGPYKLGGIEFIQNCMLFVSNGFGTSTVPLRLGAKPETHLLTLKRGYHTEIWRATGNSAVTLPSAFLCTSSISLHMMYEDSNRGAIIYENGTDYEQ